MERDGSRLVQFTWKGPDMPYHIQLEGKVWLGAIFARHLSRHPGLQKLLFFLAKYRPNGTGWLQARPVPLERAWCAISHPNVFNCTYKTYSLSNFSLCQYAFC